MSDPRRIVVAGHGMVSARFVEELLDRAEPGSVQVRVFGAEEYEPYNRVLLGEVIAGSADPSGLGLPVPDLPQLQVRYGTPVQAIDRAARSVHAGGAWQDYDELVLATGAAARIPDIPGLRPDLPSGVHVLRNLDDAREIVAATALAQSATVVGGGVLGLEVACALKRRGVEVTVLHQGSGPMDRQLDQQAGGVLSAALGRLGVRVLCQASTTAVRTVAGQLQGVIATVAGHEQYLPTELMVLTCGTVPRIGLARTSGLAVRRGVLVGSDLTSRTDAHVHAIGDCAQPPEGATGLIGQGWQQASRLAARLAAEPGSRRRMRVVRRRTVGGSRRLVPAASLDPAPAADPAPDSDVVRLKAVGLDVVAIGPPAGSGRATDRTVTLSDPSAGRHLSATVRDGVLVAATCIGAPQIAADLTAGYTRRTPAPADPVHLLIRPLARPQAAAADPGSLPADATVCSCNSVSKARIVDSWARGARSKDEIARATRATTGCGGCTEAVCGLLSWLAKDEAEGAGGENPDICLKSPVHHAETAAP